jgi:hypothetical protein
MRKPAAVRSLLYSGDLLAVDLGTFAVKVLSMRAKERSLTVLGSASREVWRELAAAKTEEEKAEVYSRVVRELMAEHAFSRASPPPPSSLPDAPAGREYSPAGPAARGPGLDPSTSRGDRFGPAPGQPGVKPPRPS